MAELLTRRFGLKPPVRIVDLAQQYADVEFDGIPGSCDGLVVGLHGPRSRPLILVDNEPHEVRKRFTVAHELGHVMLPWHVAGNVACDTARPFLDPDYRSTLTEPEANRFAGELLVPTGWLCECVDDLSDTEMAPTLRVTTEAEVSAHVACLRLAAVLPAGHLFVMLEPPDHVILSGQTPGTSLQPPGRGERLNRRVLDRFALDTEEIPYGSRRIIWWRFAGEVATDETDNDPRTASELLVDLLSRYCGDDDEYQAVQKSLAGIIGAANSVARRENDTARKSLYLRFRARFAKERDLPDAMLDDPQFDCWIRKRADELSVRD